MNDVPYVEVEHTADWSMRIQADDVQGLLINAAMGMYQLMQIEMGEDVIRQTKLEVVGHDREELLVSWLEELLFHMETRGVAFLFEEVRLNADQYQLSVSVREYPIEKVEKEIKAVTYHGLCVVETERGIEATLVFDV
jgi:SHS2 domain-containing protein